MSDTSHVRQLACVDAKGERVGVIVCDSDEAYAQAVEKIKTWSLPGQRPDDLPSVEALAARETNNGN